MSKTTTTTSPQGARLAEAVRLHTAGNLQQAHAIYGAIVSDDPDNWRAWHGLGTVDTQRGLCHTAILSLERAMALAGPLPEFHHNMASAKASLGRFAEAHAHYAEAIRLQPDYADAMYNYALIRRFDNPDELLVPINRLLARARLNRDKRRLLHFAAGKLLDDAGDYAGAFEHIEQGNRLRPASFHPAALDERMRHTLAASLPHTGSADVPAAKRASGHRFVFIVGMPRCGSSLVERMLSTHSAIHGAGERSDIPAIATTLGQRPEAVSPYPICLTELPAHVLQGFGQAYAKQVGAVAPEAAVVIDKNLLNFWHLGLITSMLPDARIIHCRRDPRDTLLSCYFQNFRDGHDYAFDQLDLVRYHTAYETVMAHWRNTLNVRMLEVDYERVVAEPEASARAMIDFVGLPFEAACATPGKTDGSVLTASKWQARQPVHDKSVSRWQNYAQWLKPMLGGLADNSSTLD